MKDRSEHPATPKFMLCFLIFYLFCRVFLQPTEWLQ